MSLSILLGSCAAAQNEPDPATILAATTKELSDARTNAAPSSVDQLDFVVDAADLSAAYDPMELSGWVSVLRPGATVSIRVQAVEEGATIDLQPIHTSFLLAGLVSSSERREADGTRVLTATKKETVTNGAPLRNVVLASLEDDDSELIDEDGLLEDDRDGLLAPPPAISESRAAKDDCGGRKACDDCTCGRKELEETDAKPKKVPTSSCGNCAKGDAFRCAGCPFLGKPAFKAGEEHLVLDLTDDF